MYYIDIQPTKGKTMDFSERLADIQEAQGWNVDSVLLLALEFIRDQHLEDGFIEHLEDQAEYENGE
jgi:hypothetical protein